MRRNTARVAELTRAGDLKGAAKAQARADEAADALAQLGRHTAGPDTSYRMEHLAPYNDSGEDGYYVTAANLGGLFPADVYDRPDLYGQVDDETITQLRAAKDDPDAMLTIYRAVPADHQEINDRDWVTLSRAYAEGHAKALTADRTDGVVVSAQVPASQVWSDGNDLHEFGYDGDGDLELEAATATVEVPVAEETEPATPQPADPNVAADHVRAVVLGRSRTPAVEVPVTKELAEARAELADQVKKVARIEASHKASAEAFRRRARGDASRERVAQKARRAELATEKDELGRAEMWVPYYRRRADELEEAHRVERAKEAGARYQAEAGLPADWDVRARVYAFGAVEVETSRPVPLSETRVPELEAYDTGDLVPVADLDLAALQGHAQSTATLTTSSGRQLQHLQFASGELIVETSDGEQTAAWVSGADRGHTMWAEVQDGLRTGGDVPHLADLAAHERAATAERKARTA